MNSFIVRFMQKVCKITSKQDILKIKKPRTVALWLKNTCSIKNFLKSLLVGITTITAQKMKFSIKDFFSKCDQIRRKLEWKTSFFVQCIESDYPSNSWKRCVIVSEECVKPPETFKINRGNKRRSRKICQMIQTTNSFLEVKYVVNL